MNTRVSWGASAMIALAFGVTACGSEDYGVGEEKSSLARLPPDAPADEVSTLVANNTDFALALFDEVVKDENFVFSPYSISAVFGMLYPGAAGATKSELQTALHFAQPDAELADSFNTLEQELASRGRDASGADGGPFRLEVSNALWGQHETKFLSSYLDVLAQDFGAGMNTVDFAADPERARLGINQWVADHTAQKITDLMPSGSLDTSTRLVLTNAVYFNAAWDQQFTAAATVNAPFTELDGSEVDVPVMHDWFLLPYAEGADWQAVELPYQGQEISMLLVLPAAGTFAAFRSSFTLDTLAQIDSMEAGAAVVLSLPRFQFTTNLALNRALQALGMQTAFTGACDLSGIDGNHDLRVSNVVHQALIRVDEKGTEAAAATAVETSASGPGGSLVVFDARRPFLFAIRDNATKAVLFWGQVLNPLG